MSAQNKVLNVHRPVSILLDRIYVVAILDMNLTSMDALAMVHYLPFNNHIIIYRTWALQSQHSHNYYCS